MTSKIQRSSYVEMYGPTTGDKVRLADTDLFIDDEGLLVEEQRFFSIDNKVFAGNGLIVGAVNEEGHSTTPTYPDDFLPVTWMPKSYQMEITADDLNIEIRRSDDTTYQEA